MAAAPSPKTQPSLSALRAVLIPHKKILRTPLSKLTFAVLVFSNN